MYSDFNALKSETTAKMEKTLDVLSHELSGLRTGRASVALLDGIVVEAYGSPTPLNQLASLSTPDARTISVSVWDRSNAAAVEKAIRDAGLGLNPASDGTLIRIPLPALTEERRKELTKVAAGYAEQAKQSIRRLRKDALDAAREIEKAEDARRLNEEAVQKLTDSFVGRIDEALKVKQSDIMSI